MSEWKEKTLNEVCQKITDGSHYSPVNVNIGYPMLSVKDMREYDFDFSSCKHISSEDFSTMRLNDCIPQVGDVLVAKDGSYLKEIFCCKEYRDIAILSSIAVFRPNQDIILPNFLCYLLKAPFIFNYISKNCVSGSALPRIVLKSFKDVRIPVPNLFTQSEIAGILSSLDAKIETNNKLNEKLEEMAQAIFKSWLSDCDETISIGELSQNITDYSKVNKENVILINSSDVTNGFFDHHNYSENKNIKGHFKKRFYKGDILYSQVRPRNRHWAYCYFDADDYIASTQLMVIRNNEEELSSLLLYQYLISDRVWNEFTLKTETRSGTFPQGNYEDLSKICVPYKKDNKSICKTLETIYNSIYKRYEENQRLASLRDTLLPRLMSGEIKL